MANTYPLKPLAPTPYKDGTPMATQAETDRYKALLGTQAASVEVGLFYQLNQNATEAAQEATANGGTYNQRFPLEANSAYA